VIEFAPSVRNPTTHDHIQRKWRLKYWIPYRVILGDESKVERVTTEPILRKWRSIGQIALLAMTNATIFETVVRCFLTDMAIESHESEIPSAPFDVNQSQEMPDNECDEICSCGFR
jgi:hypothetical protein